MKLTGYSAKDPIIYQSDSDISMILEQRFGGTSGDYFVLTQQTIKDPATKESFVVVYLEDKDSKKHSLFFKKQ